MSTQASKILIQLLIIMALGVLGGCGFNPSQIGQAPTMTPVGAGLRPETIPVSVEPKRRPVYRPGNSLWQDSSADLFTDPRASRVGDIVTVKISIKDKASLDNKSNRSRKSDGNLNAKFDYSLDAKGFSTSSSGEFKPSVNAETKSDSEGGIERSETINLLVAALVTQVLPNGNLMISGTQEVRVNFEMRMLQVAGIVRPVDISTENTVSYERIAEARISYGGAGRITEIQQPGWGQQLMDGIAPY